jgi:molecular chaperone GrpE
MTNDPQISEPHINDQQISESTSQHITIEDLQSELNTALTQAEDNLTGWKRAQADLENFRKRIESESAEWVAFGKQSAFAQILPALDSLQQAITYAPVLEDEKYKNWKTGLEGIAKQVDTAIAQAGIEKIEAVGKKFDPNYHEAIKEVPGQEDGMVVEQYQTGFMINGKVIRPAQVAISQKNSQ